MVGDVRFKRKKLRQTSWDVDAERNPFHVNYGPGPRPEHQEVRGPRYGNKRKMVAKQKVKARRAEKRSDRQKALNYDGNE